MDWFLYDRDLRYERAKKTSVLLFPEKSILDIWLCSWYDYDNASVKKNPYFAVFQS